jgi:hypothetical protein
MDPNGHCKLAFQQVERLERTANPGTTSRCRCTSTSPFQVSRSCNGSGRTRSRSERTWCWTDETRRASLSTSLLTLPAIRSAFRRLTALCAVPSGETNDVPPLTGPARVTVVGAPEEARSLGYSYIGTSTSFGPRRHNIGIGHAADTDQEKITTIGADGPDCCSLSLGRRVMSGVFPHASVLWPNHGQDRTCPHRAAQSFPPRCARGVRRRRLEGRVHEYLRERPFVALRIAAGVATMAERQVSQLLDDRYPGGSGAIMMGIDGGHQDVDQGRAPDLGRVTAGG